MLLPASFATLFLSDSCKQLQRIFAKDVIFKVFQPSKWANSYFQYVSLLPASFACTLLAAEADSCKQVERPFKKDTVEKSRVRYKSDVPTRLAAKACKNAIVKVLRSSHGDQIVFSIHI